jgi:hypothetical protein
VKKSKKHSSSRRHPFEADRNLPENPSGPSAPPEVPDPPMHRPTVDEDAPEESPKIRNPL